MGWFYSHLGSMLGGGIAFHTAFIVFGAQSLWPWELAGPLAVAPWILPTVVGIPAIVVRTRYYRRKFEPAAPAADVGRRREHSRPAGRECSIPGSGCARGLRRA